MCDPRPGHSFVAFPVLPSLCHDQSRDPLLNVSWRCSLSAPKGPARSSQWQDRGDGRLPLCCALQGRLLCHKQFQPALKYSVFVLVLTAPLHDSSHCVLDKFHQLQCSIPFLMQYYRAQVRAVLCLQGQCHHSSHGTSPHTCLYPLLPTFFAPRVI